MNVKMDRSEKGRGEEIREEERRGYEGILSGLTQCVTERLELNLHVQDSKEQTVAVSEMAYCCRLLLTTWAWEGP